MSAPMRDRRGILDSLESVYRDVFQAARERSDERVMERLDLEYQRDQLHLEVLLDIRALLDRSLAEPDAPKVSSLIDRAQALKKLTRLR